MNILLIKNKLPYPLRSGQDLVDYSLLKALSQKHEITLIAPSNSYEEIEEALPGLRDLCSDVKAVFIPGPDSTGEKFKWRLRRESDFWLKFIPLEVSDLYHEPLRKTITDTVAGTTFDFAEIAFWTMGSYLSEIKPACPTFLLQHDSAYLFYKRQKLSRHKKKTGVKMREWYAELTSLLNYEKAVCRHFDWVFFISASDRQNLSEEFGVGEKSSVVPIPYAIEPQAVGGENAALGEILFLGECKRRTISIPSGISNIRYCRLFRRRFPKYGYSSSAIPRLIRRRRRNWRVPASGISAFSRT